MWKDKLVFSVLDESFHNIVMFGNNSTILVISRGNVKIHTRKQWSDYF